MINWIFNSLQLLQNAVYSILNIRTRMMHSELTLSVLNTCDNIMMLQRYYNRDQVTCFPMMQSWVQLIPPGPIVRADRTRAKETYKLCLGSCIVQDGL